VDEAKSHHGVDWLAYFARINSVCPWSLPAWQSDRIDIVRSRRRIIPLGTFIARVYVLNLSRRRLKKLCAQRDHGEDEWLWAHPEYGAFAPPVACLIQQNRALLSRLRG
jgi:hypothetical protein